MDIKVKEASEEHRKSGWVLDYHQLVDIQQRLEASDVYIDLEEIESVLLASKNREHLINP